MTYRVSRTTLRRRYSQPNVNIMLTGGGDRLENVAIM